MEESPHAKKFKKEDHGEISEATSQISHSNAFPHSSIQNEENISDKDQLIAHLREKLQQSEQRWKNQQIENKKRESAFLLRLNSKEQEIHELQNQVHDLRHSINGSIVQHVKTNLHIDPLINLHIQKLRDELDENEKKLKITQEEFEAFQFNNQSITGKKILARCRLLQEENEEFEQQVTKLETELSLQKEVSEELKRNLSECTEFISQLNEEMDAMQSEILSLRQQLYNKNESH